jgi:hypothetical protein
MFYYYYKYSRLISTKFVINYLDEEEMDVFHFVDFLVVEEINLIDKEKYPISKHNN